MRMNHCLPVPTLFNGGTMCTSAAIVIALIISTIVLQAGEGVDHTVPRGIIQVAANVSWGQKGFGTSAHLSGIFRNATPGGPTVDAGTLVIDGLELQRDTAEIGINYHHSALAMKYADGITLSIEVEGNAQSGISGFIDSVYCPAAFHLVGLTFDSTIRTPTIRRSQDLVLSWNPDPNTDSVQIMLVELRVPSQSDEEDTSASVVMAHVADDGSHTITQEELRVFGPSLREVTFIITRSTENVVVHNAQNFLLKGRFTVLVTSTLAD